MTNLITAVNTVVGSGYYMTERVNTPDGIMVLIRWRTEGFTEDVIALAHTREEAYRKVLHYEEERAGIKVPAPS